jgi:hypothetical protein
MSDEPRMTAREALVSTIQLAHRAAARETPTPQAGDVWRVRWEELAGTVLIIGVGGTGARIAPVSFDTEPDDSAVLAPAFSSDLGFDMAIWAADESDVPLRVFECKLGELTIAGTEGLRQGTKNWGATDPRTRTRAHLQDLVEFLQDATWAPQQTNHVSLQSLLAHADIGAVANALGSLPIAMQLRRGEGLLTAEQAKQLAPVLGATPAELLAANPPLPNELVAEMDQPRVRTMVDRVAVERDQDELETWLTAAYGVLALAARQSSRATIAWAGRIDTYFNAVLNTPE